MKANGLWLMANGAPSRHHCNLSVITVIEWEGRP